MKRTVSVLTLLATFLSANVPRTKAFVLGPIISTSIPNTIHDAIGRENPRSTCVRLFGKRGNGKVKKNRVSKSNLPEKICVVCGRPFTWRKKWERCWDEVTCCSKSCNAKRRGGSRDDGFVNYEN
jgi:hypothetical protein